MELEMKQVTKCYGATLALDNFSYRFTEGVYGLLGPNGSGKTTMMNLMTTNLKPTQGSLLYDGEDIFSMGKEYRRLLGFMPQQQGVYPGYTLERFLWYMATLKGLSRQETKQSVENVVKRVNLEDCRNKRLGSFSGGMKQRALIAQALLGNPRLIILDEPTAGLDPRERIRIRNLIAEIAMEKIVILATHVVSDISYIAKEVLLLKKGRLIDSGVPYQLSNTIADKVYELKVNKDELEQISAVYKVSSMREDGRDLYVRILSDDYPEEWDAAPCTPDLEDVYLYHFD